MDLSSMWDNVLSLVTEGVDFELLPITSESPLGLQYDDDDDQDVAGGPPPPFSFCNGGGRMAADGGEPTGPVDDCDGDEIMAAGGPPPPPPPGPPPPPMMAKADPHTEAMQKVMRLRMRIKGVNGSKDKELKKKAGDSGDVCLDYDELDEKGRQWADFNARGHKLKDGRAFIDLANQKRKEIDHQLKHLKSKSDEEVFTLEELDSAVGVLDTAGNWYQGGIKELRIGNSVYKELEKLIETMVEFFTLRGEMIDLPHRYQCDGDPQEVLKKIQLEFTKKHKRFIDMILSGVEVWRKYRFPVCDKLLWKCQGYLCGMVVKFVETSLKAAASSTKAKQRVEESICLLQTAAPYFSLGQSATEEGVCKCEVCSEKAESNTSQQNGYQTFVQDDLLKLTVKVAETYFQLGIEQFDKHVHKMGERKICDHFQSILSILKKVEDLVNDLPRDEVDDGRSQQKAAGVIGRLPESDGLKQTMSRSCQSLCGHVEREARIYIQLPSDKEDEAKQEKTKEMVHWMSFYCKYNYRISTASGSPPANHEKITHDTVWIAFSFIEDNLKQYDEFVHILDGKRVRAHFDRIMRVVISLASNLPTNGSGDSKSAKYLESLPNSKQLIATVIQSCECLVEHYQNHEQFHVELLQTTVGEAAELKKKKEEVTKWLAFGGEYIYEMLKALGPKHTTIVMRVFSEFEKVTSNLEAILSNTKA